MNPAQEAWNAAALAPTKQMISAGVQIWSLTPQLALVIVYSTLIAWRTWLSSGTVCCSASSVPINMLLVLKDETPKITFSLQSHMFYMAEGYELNQRYLGRMWRNYPDLMSLCSLTSLAQWHGATVMALESFSPSPLSHWEFNSNEESKGTDCITDELLIPDIFHATSKGNRGQKILGCFLMSTTCSTVMFKVAVAPNKTGSRGNAALHESRTNYSLCLCSNLCFGILLLCLWLFVRSCCDEQRLHKVWTPPPKKKRILWFLLLS